MKVIQCFENVENDFQFVASCMQNIIINILHYERLFLIVCQRLPDVMTCILYLDMVTDFQNPLADPEGPRYPPPP